MLNEFKDFILKGNIIAIAIGLVLAAAFGEVVKAFVENIITPIVGSLSNGGIGDVLRIHLRGANYITIGGLINAIITFLSVAAALFFCVIKPLKKMGYSPDAE